MNPKLYNPRSETDCQIEVFDALLLNVWKWQAVLAMDDRYFHSAFKYVSFNMTFFVVVCHFCFKILPDSNKRFPLFVCQIPIIWENETSQMGGFPWLIKDQRNFYSNTFFKLFTNSVSAHSKIKCSRFFYTQNDTIFFIPPVGNLPKIEECLYLTATMECNSF